MKDVNDVVIRHGDQHDRSAVERALYLALAWDDDPAIPDMDVVLAHPEVRRYHSDWGRVGDAVAVAERDGQFVGAAYYRLFTVDDHGDGFVDEETPEIAIGVERSGRGLGVGAALMQALADMARASGIERLSLSVKPANPARRLYERLGYETLTEDEGSVRMVYRIP